MTEIQRRLQRLEGVKRAEKEALAVLDTLDITKHMAAIYLPLHEDLKAGVHQNVNLPGGRGSCKSSFVSLEIVNGIMQDSSGRSSAIVFRRTGATMRDSVFSQIAWAVDVTGTTHLWDSTVSPMRFVYKPTGAEIVFRGLDESTKLKSIKPRRGFFRYVWLEEASELPGSNFMRNVLQSVVRGGDKVTVFKSYNPPQSRSNWINRYIMEPDPTAITLHTNYLDVPQEWLGPSFIAEAERLREVNEAAYRHEYLGLAEGTGGSVFLNLEARAITDEEIEEMGYFYSGLDWGFSVDPFAFVRCSYDKRKDTLFITDELYQRGCSNAQIADMICERGLDKVVKPRIGRSLFTGMEYLSDMKQLIVADSAEPKSIADLQTRGLRVVACKKYAGSVLYGTKWLQGRKIVVDPERTPNAWRELSEYEYTRTRDGEITADLPDENNHIIDALRYACDQLINTKGSKGVSA